MDYYEDFDDFDPIDDQKEREYYSQIYTHERPNWGKRQIRDKNKIIPGKFYLKISLPPTDYQKSFGYVCKILALPNKDGRTKATEMWKNSNNKLDFNDTHFYLQDCSVTQYDGGRWNNLNFLFATKAKTVEGAFRSLEKLMRKLQK